MRVLGIDPGYAILGWGVLDVEGNHFKVIAYDSILTDKDTPMPRRLQELHMGLKEIIEKYKPEEAAIEELYFNNNAKTAIMVGEARGVAVLACALVLALFFVFSDLIIAGVKTLVEGLK